MELIEAYGLSRNRDRTGKVVSRHLNEYVNCIHTQVGGARDNMEIYVVEVWSQNINSINTQEVQTRGGCLTQIYVLPYPHQVGRIIVF